MTDDPLLTVPEIAERLRCTQKTVQKLIASGRLPGALRAEHVFRMPAAALEALVVPPAPKRKAKKRRAPKRATR